MGKGDLTSEERLAALEEGAKKVDQAAKDLKSTLDKGLVNVLDDLEAAFSSSNTADITELSEKLASMGPPAEASAKQLEEYEKRLIGVIGAYERASKAPGMQIADNILGKFGVSAAEADSNLVSLTAQLIGNEGAWNTLIDKMAEAVVSGALFGSMIQQSQNATSTYFKELDQTRKELNKFAGANQMYYNSAVQAERVTRQFNVDLEDTAKATRAAGDAISQFNKFSQAQRTELVGNIAVLERSGIETNTAAENIQFLNLSLGMTPKAAADSQAKIVSLANELGRSTQQMASDFAQSQNDLAKYGSKAIDTFVTLQKAAKEAGMEMDELLSITNKFDTFDGAAKQVGTLNAMLGGPYLNSMEMVMETDPTKRMEMLTGAVHSAGLSFESMSYYQKQAIANAMDLDNVNDLAKIMQGSFDDLSSSTGTFADNMEDLEEKSDKFATISEELTTIGRAFIVDFIEPVLPLLHGIVSVMAKISQSDFLRYTILTGAALGMVYIAFKKIRDAKKGVMDAYAKFGAVKATFTAITTAETEALMAEKLAAKGSKKTNKVLAQGIKVLSRVLPQMWAIAAAIAAVGLAALGMGAGVFLAAKGIAALLGPLGEFLTNVSLADMMQLPVFLAALALSFLMFAPLGSLMPFIALGFVTVVAGITALGMLGWVLSKVLSPMAKSLTNIVADLDRLKTSAVTTLGVLTDLKVILTAGIGNPFDPMVTSANALALSIRQISTEMSVLKNKGLLDQSPLPKLAGYTAVNAALQSVKAAVALTTMTQTPNQEINITAIIEADGKAVATAVFDTIKTHGKTRDEITEISHTAAAKALG